MSNRPTDNLISTQRLKALDLIPGLFLNNFAEIKTQDKN